MECKQQCAQGGSISELTKGHFTADELGISLNIGDGGDRYRPIGNWSPEVGAGRDKVCALSPG